MHRIEMPLTLVAEYGRQFALIAYRKAARHPRSDDTDSLKSLQWCLTHSPESDSTVGDRIDIPRLSGPPVACDTEHPQTRAGVEDVRRMFDGIQSLWS
jgi:hypothetical protein